MSEKVKVVTLKVGVPADESDTYDLILDFDGCEQGAVFLVNPARTEDLFQTTIEAVIAAGEWLKQQKEKQNG